MSKDLEATLKAVGCLSIFVGILIGAVWGGCVLSVVWNWFMPVIFGLPYLTIPQAIAVAVIVGWLTEGQQPYQKRPNDEVWISAFSGVVTAFATPLFVLVIAWVLKAFV